MTAYPVALLDPRVAGAAANDAVFAAGPVLGIEITIPHLAERCTVGNVDPQHTGGDAMTAACEVAAKMPLPDPTTTLAILRPDPDALASVVVLRRRAAGVELTPDAAQRLGAIAARDTFLRGPWVPSQAEAWYHASAEELELEALTDSCLDFRVPIEDRVMAVARYLDEGTVAPVYRAAVHARRAALADAVRSGEAVIKTHEGRMVSIVTTLPQALAAGYGLAPVVIAKNPRFSWAGGPPIVKYTICQWQLGYVDLRAVVRELTALEGSEGTWGGSPTIIGSPQGVSSTIGLEEVEQVVWQYLLSDASA